MLVMPSDHLIANVPAFMHAVHIASASAKAGYLMTFGIKPDRPETGFGYIKNGAALAADVFRVSAFVEKPDIITAKHYVSTGEFHWNAGIFLFTAGSYLNELRRLAPDIFVSAETAMASAGRVGSIVRPGRTAMETCRAQSIDKAVLEHSERVAVVPIEVGWSDVGTFDSLYAVGAQDRLANVSQGPTLPLDTTGCLLLSNGPLITTVGVSDLVVIATPDAILIVRRGETERVRELIDQLEVNAPGAL
jgi:mannose-1-phosphate guanylyltransferase/mannose-1-phosphate guanylyltransferase/mannose-6-phosphate isomerase